MATSLSGTVEDHEQRAGPAGVLLVGGLLAAAGVVAFVAMRPDFVLIPDGILLAVPAIQGDPTGTPRRFLVLGGQARPVPVPAGLAAAPYPSTPALQVDPLTIAALGIGDPLSAPFPPVGPRPDLPGISRQAVAGDRWAKPLRRGISNVRSAAGLFYGEEGPLLWAVLVAANPAARFTGPGPAALAGDTYLIVPPRAAARRMIRNIYFYLPLLGPLAQLELTG